MPVPEQIFGWSEDPYDPRDEQFKFSPAEHAPNVQIKPVVYNITPAVKNQLKEGSCGPHAATELFESVEIMTRPPEQRPRLSPQFLYFHYRERCGEITVDCGVVNRTLMTILAADGVCAEALWPYSMDTFAQKPTDAAYADAVNHKPAIYRSVDQDLADLLICLSAGNNILAGAALFESFKGDGVTQTGIVPMPDPKEKIIGGHDFLIHGHNVHERKLICQNSWDIDWGCQPPTYPTRGHFYLPFEYLLRWGNSFWTITK